MLTKHDLKPQPIPGRYRAANQGHVIDGRNAYNLACAGVSISPADQDTAEMVASRIENAGNPTRAAAILRAFGVPEMTKVEPEPAAEPFAMEPDADPEESAIADSVTVTEQMMAAGNDVLRLRAIASSIGLEFKDRWSAAKLRNEITKHEAMRLAKMGGDGQ